MTAPRDYPAHLAEFHAAGDDPVARLKAVVKFLADADPDEAAVTASFNVGTGERTGLTYGDLTAIAQALGGVS